MPLDHFRLRGQLAESGLLQLESGTDFKASSSPSLHIPRVGCDMYVGDVQYSFDRVSEKARSTELGRFVDSLHLEYP